MQILINGLTQRPGGGMVVLQGLVSGIASASLKVIITVIAYDDTVIKSLRGLGHNNVEIIKIDKWTELSGKLLVPYHVRSATRRYKCDVLLTLNFYVPFLSVPQIVYHVDMERFEHHGFFPLSIHNILEKVRDASAKRALRLASANVFESNFVKKAAEDHCQLEIRKPSVIYIGIDGSSIVAPDSTNSDFDDGLIVVVSNPLKYKNNESLVPILTELINRRPEINWRIRLYGGQDISVWAELIKMAEAAGIETRFEFMGYRTHAELNSALDVAVCHLNTSRLESFCMVALEAMARGCPVIVAPDAAMPESVGDAGFVIDPDNFSAVAGQILKLHDDGIQRISIKNQGILWANRHTWESSGQEFYKLSCELSAS